MSCVREPRENPSESALKLKRPRSRGRLSPVGRRIALLVGAALCLGGCASRGTPHAVPTIEEVRQIKDAAERLGIGRVASLRGEISGYNGHYTPIRVGLIMPNLMEETPGEKVIETLQPLAREAQKILRDVEPRRDLHIDVYSPLDGLSVWVTFKDGSPRDAVYEEVIQDHRIRSSPLFADSAPLSPGLRRGFFLPFSGLPDVALSYGGREAAYLDVSRSVLTRLKPQLEGLAAGGDGNPMDMRFYGLELRVASAPDGKVTQTFPLRNLIVGRGVAFSPDGRTLALMGREKGSPQAGPWKVWLVDRVTNDVKPFCTPPQPKTPRAVNTLAWSPDGSMLAVGIEGMPGFSGGGMQLREWLENDRVIVYQMDGKPLANLHGRVPSWHPSEPKLLLARDAARQYRFRMEDNRHRTRWMHQIIEARFDGGKAQERMLAETERWVFNPPVWLASGNAYLTVENAVFTGAFGWRNNGIVMLRRTDSEDSKLLGIARLSGSPDGSALILRSGRQWRWVAVNSTLMAKLENTGPAKKLPVRVVEEEGLPMPASYRRDAGGPIVR